MHGACHSGSGSLRSGLRADSGRQRRRASFWLIEGMPRLSARWLDECDAVGPGLPCATPAGIQRLLADCVGTCAGVSSRRLDLSDGLAGHEPSYDLSCDRLVLRQPLHLEQVALENDRERVAVGEVEIAEAHEQHVELKGIDTAAETAIRLAGVKNLANETQNRRGNDRGPFRALEVLGLEQVLAAQ
jgi:hypothetical protein